MWTDSEHVQAWCAPLGFAVTVGYADVRPGGEWSTTLRGPDGRDINVRGAYRAVEPGRRLVLTHAWVDEAGNIAPMTVVSIDLEDTTDGKTRLILHQAAFDTEASRDGHAVGWGEALDSLEAHVAQLVADQTPTLHCPGRGCRSLVEPR